MFPWKRCLFFLYRIEDHHVQFKVEPNPQDIDAETMVEKLSKYKLWATSDDVTKTNKRLFSPVSDRDLQKRISNQIGVDVDNAAAGDRVRKILFTHR